ncbi:MAG: RT0821/Lpp0805 family surface protein [Colwellia sp.]
MKQFSISQALLALAIAWLAYSLTKVATQVPVILQAVDKASITVEGLKPEIEDIMKTVDEAVRVVDETVKVVDGINQQIPDILNQVELTRPTISEVVQESQQYSSQLPTLFLKLDSLEKQLQDIQKQLPSVLKRVDAIVLSTNSTVDEAAKWRPHSQRYLAQIEYSREDIPQYLTRVEDIVVDAKSIGKEASSGLFVGLVKGVVSLPFDVVSGLKRLVDENSRSAKYLTDSDIVQIQESAIKLLNSSSKEMKWNNPETRNHGLIIKGKMSKSRGRNCRKLTLTNYFNKEKEVLKELMCKNEEGIWKVQ